jgi:hypothetical protein
MPHMEGVGCVECVGLIVGLLGEARQCSIGAMLNLGGTVWEFGWSKWKNRKVLPGPNFRTGLNVDPANQVDLHFHHPKLTRPATTDIYGFSHSMKVLGQ